MPNAKCSGLHIDVAPTERQRLTLPQPEGNGDGQQGFKTIATNLGQKLSRFIRRQGCDLCSLNAWRFDKASHIPCEDFVLDGSRECSAQNGMKVLNCTCAKARIRLLIQKASYLLCAKF